MALLYCPECDGEGSHTYVGGPGYYSASFGNYLPSEREVLCETCQGEGEVKPCPGCHGGLDQHDYCPRCHLYEDEHETEEAA